MARACNGCALCCYLPSVPDLKESWEWCTHCTRHACRIYESRPGPCRDFNCAWLRNERVPAYWYPKRSRMVLCNKQFREGPAVTCLVDPQFPDRWREEPYYTDIKLWAAKGLAAPQRTYFHVFCGTSQHWLILPTKDVPNPTVGRLVQHPDLSYDFIPGLEDRSRASRAGAAG